jgi:hypothetical protein
MECRLMMMLGQAQQILSQSIEFGGWNKLTLGKGFGLVDK